MTTLYLTDAQRDTFTACGLIVIDGEAGWHHHDETCPSDQCAYWTAPPEGWRILTEPCPRCGGSGFVKSDHPVLDAIVSGGYSLIEKRPCPNPDCVGGRRVVTLTATCPNCKGDGTTYDRTAIDAYEISACEECPAQEGDDDTGTGVVTLGRFTIRLLPVVGERDIFTATGRYVLVLDEGTVWLPHDSEDHGTRTQISIYPLPRPGQFIARPERVA